MLNDEELLEDLKYFPLKEDIEILFDEIEVYHDFEVVVSFSKEFIDLDNFNFKEVPTCRVRLEYKNDNHVRDIMKEKTFLESFLKIEKILSKQGIEIGKTSVRERWITYHLYSKITKIK